jgi:hypothetical protein
MCVDTNLLFGKARVYHKHHSIDGEGGFCDVGGDNDLPTDGSVGPIGRRRFEDALL